VWTAIFGRIERKIGTSGGLYKFTERGKGQAAKDAK
jgi:hypothetical protein